MSRTGNFYIIGCIFFLALSGLNSLPIEEPVDNGSDGRSALEFGDKFQGDIVLTSEQEANINDTSRGSRTGILSTRNRWPKNAQGYVMVPYTYRASAGFSQADKNVILQGMQEIERRTCIRFPTRSNQADYIEIINGGGCYSYLGRIGGKQDLSLQRNGCVYKGTVMHEIIHALGYDHMHNHVNRDNYIRVYLENVEPQYRYAFNKVDSRSFGNFGTPYDLLSVMHYPRWAFSFNGRDTMVPHDRSYIDRIGANQLTAGDVARIRNMYQCTV